MRLRLILQLAAKELVKKYDVERRTRRTRRKTLRIFLCGFRGFCVVRDLFTRSNLTKGLRYCDDPRALRSRQRLARQLLVTTDSSTSRRSDQLFIVALVRVPPAPRVAWAAF